MKEKVKVVLVSAMFSSCHKTEAILIFVFHLSTVSCQQIKSSAGMSGSRGNLKQNMHELKHILADVIKMTSLTSFNVGAETDYKIYFSLSSFGWNAKAKYLEHG